MTHEPTVFRPVRRAWVQCSGLIACQPHGASQTTAFGLLAFEARDLVKQLQEALEESERLVREGKVKVE